MEDLSHIVKLAQSLGCWVTTDNQHDIKIISPSYNQGDFIIYDKAFPYETKAIYYYGRVGWCLIFNHGHNSWRQEEKIPLESIENCLIMEFGG